MKMLIVGAGVIGTVYRAHVAAAEARSRCWPRAEGQ